MKRAENLVKIVGMIGIDDEIRLRDRRLQPITLRRLAREARLTLRHFESGASRRAIFWVDVISPAEPNASEGFWVTEDIYRELRAMGVPVVDD